MLARLSLATLLSVAAAACGDNGGGNGTADARRPSRDGSVESPDAAIGPVACMASSFVCSASLPVCDQATMMCAAAPGSCTGDDPQEPNDGPTQATVVTGSTIAGAICSMPGFEEDWFRLTLAAGHHRFLATWQGGTEPDIDGELYDSAGKAYAIGRSTANNRESFYTREPLPGGEYLLRVTMYEPFNSAASVAYSISIERGDCANNFECIGMTGEPVCTDGLCTAGPRQCTGDDEGDNGGGDDGPGGARVIGPTPIAASLCATPFEERDWYKIDVAAGQGLAVTAAFPAEDFDILVYNARGEAMGQGLWQRPEKVTLSYLAAGTYYIGLRVFKTLDPQVAAPYTLTVAATPAAVCTSRVDCAAEYETQYYRGDCVAGVCQPLSPATPLPVGMPCDSNSDCADGLCTYMAFEADAGESLCSGSCTTTADCARIGAGLTCTTGFQTNFCTPRCTSDRDCGVLSFLENPDPGQPWAYMTCNVGNGTCGP